MNENMNQEKKRHSSVNLDKLLEEHSQIEKKFAEVNGKNNLLEIQLERLNRLWKISQAKEQSSAEECAVLRNMIKGLQETMEAQCNMKDENCSLKKTINGLEEKLQSVTQGSLMTDLSSLFTKMTADMHVIDNRVSHLEDSMEECTSTVNDLIDSLHDVKDEQSWLRAAPVCKHRHFTQIFSAPFTSKKRGVLIAIKDSISFQMKQSDYKGKMELLTHEMRDKEEEFKAQMEKKCCEVETKLLLKEEEKSKLLSKKEIEISELTRQLKTQEKEKQSELIKQQIEFNAKLARIQNRSNKSYQETSTLSQNIYRMKLQHLQEEKTKEIENLRSTIKELERKLNGGTDSRLKRKRF
ncbi:coiled-coil domain-containing protein 152 [Rana temporaria]|uniref:coiled-coil domain-containing protein 152 n=1 Tax=Rana temporaria TaxID=8407 RepID=UPI001AACF30A|nr:coiled-coil domain-containing protein 152 [Rana temporaria]